jgi:hypothetical protein
MLAILQGYDIIWVMKQSANKVSIHKTGRSYSAIVRNGRNTKSFNFRTKNMARSFVRRNFKQVGTYN